MLPAQTRDRLIHRRAFLAALGGALALRFVPSAAQVPAKAPRIGWLTSSVVHTSNVEAFRQEMQALGHGEVRLEVRAAEGKMDRLSALAAELAALPLDVIVTDGGPAAVAARKATTTMPIVIGAAAIDLVRQGVVTSLARPGGNVTGFVISTGTELDGKRLELLREAIPALARVAVVWNPRNDANPHKLASLDGPARALGVQIESIQARDVQDLERALSGAARKRVGAMLTLADAFLWSQREHIVAVAARHRLPAMYPELDFSESGGLMAYGPAVADNFRRAAGYVDRILKGTKPGDLPIEQPAKIELMINLRTARILGLTLPQSILVRAQRVLD
ncbi:MAG TPA: ABC transporter substrate-binding protein [Gemmatimonadales bacterium]|nr:ABC transporter substrate-binding protein [Gemmatimonadales bacterium]